MLWLLLYWLLRSTIAIDISGVNDARDVMDDGLSSGYRWGNRRLKQCRRYLGYLNVQMEHIILAAKYLILSCIL